MRRLVSLGWIDAIGGKFATRLFVRFLVAAALPVAAVTLLFAVYTAKETSEQAYARLHRASANYGNALYSRLVLAKNQLGIIERVSTRSSDHDPVVSEAFRAVEMFSTSGVRRVLVGKDSELPGELAKAQEAVRPGDPILATAGYSNGRADLLMIEASRDGRGTLVGRLNLRYLFGTEEQWPYSTKFCVLAVDTLRPVFCPGMNDIATVLAKRVVSADGNRTLARLQIGNQPETAVHWDLFLPSGFRAPTWRIVALEPASQVPVSAFEGVFIPAVLLVFFSAGLVGFYQIKRMNRPLQKLSGVVAEMAAGRFDARVEVDSADEFEELAHAFNGMGARIGRQFHTLQTLSEVDRRILASDGLHAVVGTVLKQVGRIIVSDFIAILIPDFEVPRRRQLFVVDNADPSLVTESHFRLESYSFPERFPGPSPITHNLRSDACPRCLRGLAGAGAVLAVGVPCRVEAELTAWLIVAYRHRAAPSERDLAEARTVADRLAVALAAVRRNEQLVRQARYDLLTQLPNRQLLLDRLGQESARSYRNGCHFAVLFVDLDRFKNVNDTAGHAVGDQLLMEAGSRLRGCLRDVDTAARWGGDEFIIVAAGLDQSSHARHVARNAIAALSAPYHIEGHEYHVGASIGIAVYPGDGDDPSALLKNADVALYRAKEAGRGRAVFFESGMNDTVRRRSELEAALRRAVDEEQFFVVYQPQIRLEDGTVEAVEALIRWNHPEQGLISPAEFVPVLEDIGAIGAVGEWVLREACREMSENFGRGDPAIDRVAVNVSARQFWGGDFPEMVRRALTETAMSGSSLELEITEGVLLSNIADAAKIMEELREMGIRVSLDDFGTGYSSLSYLRQLPIDVVKIDRMFINDIEWNPEALAIVEAIIDMVHALGRSIVAEGVENEDQVRLLTDRRCELGQGFYFCRPASADGLASYLVDTRREQH